jgi:hypothetical protein
MKVNGMCRNKICNVPYPRLIEEIQAFPVTRNNFNYAIAIFRTVEAADSHIKREYNKGAIRLDFINMNI